MDAMLIRIIVIYLFVMIAFRCLGKRQLGALSPFELVTVMLIPEILSGTLAGQASLLQGLAGVSMILLLVFAYSLLAHRFPHFQRLGEAEPTVLVDHGKLCVEALNRERITADEIMSEIRKHGFSRLDSVRWAILESGGLIAVVPYEEGAGQSAAPRRMLT